MHSQNTPGIYVHNFALLKHSCSIFKLELSTPQTQVKKTTESSLGEYIHKSIFKMLQSIELTNFIHYKCIFFKGNPSITSHIMITTFRLVSSWREVSFLVCSWSWDPGFVNLLQSVTPEDGKFSQHAPLQSEGLKVLLDFKQIPIKGPRQLVETEQHKSYLALWRIKNQAIV